MSKYNVKYNLGPFDLKLSTDNIEFVDNLNTFLHVQDEESNNSVLNLEVVDNPEILNDIIKTLSNSKTEVLSGYMKTPLLHFEDENFVYNYDEKRNLAVLKNQKDGSVQVVLDSEKSQKFSSVPMYIAREMIIREHENLGNHILHSASVSVDGKGYVLVGGPGAGKTSLMLGLLKGGEGKVEYVSNDINFVTPDLKMFYPFQLPMLLSDATANSYFKNDKELEGVPTISYFHEKEQGMITKYKLSRVSVEDLFNVDSVHGASLSGVIIPKFSKGKDGFDVQILDGNFASEVVESQVLEGDDRFSVDYLKLGTHEREFKPDCLEELVKNSSTVLMTYGKNVFEDENVKDLPKVFKFFDMIKQSSFELHCHTTASDGKKSPTEVVDVAVDKGIEMLAITDHNTVEGIRQASQYVKEKNINIDLINGIELDACDKSCLHILGYGIKDLDKMANFLKYYDEKNDEVYEQIIDNLVGLGVDISKEKVLKEFNAEKLSKQRIGNYLKAKGYANSTSEVTQKYLGKDAPAYVPRVQPTAKECIDIISSCGGISVLAHPMELMKYNEELSDEGKVVEVIEGLKMDGLDGVECCTYKHTPEQEGILLETSDKLGLVKTIGSDYHSDDLQKFGCDEDSIIEDFKIKLAETDMSMDAML